MLLKKVIFSFTNFILSILFISSTKRDRWIKHMDSTPLKWPIQSYKCRDMNISRWIIINWFYLVYPYFREVKSKTYKEIVFPSLYKDKTMTKFSDNLCNLTRTSIHKISYTTSFSIKKQFTRFRLHTTLKLNDPRN